jgi:lysophospholipase L1-like esterase
MPGRTALMLASVLVALLAGELALRAWTGHLRDPRNLVLIARQALSDSEGARFVHDPLLGFVPRSGLRPNGAVPADTLDAGKMEASKVGTGRPAVLAVGDSYTYGEEVADSETWPALLQARLGRPVLNGGVSGYGLDQAVLRAEVLAEHHHPTDIVVSFIADDIRRTEMSRVWGAEKPYFDIEDDAGGKDGSKSGLVLRNVPVPPRPDPDETLDFWRRTLGYSFLVDFVLRRLDLLHDWLNDDVRVHPEGSGAELACRLTGRLAELQRISGARVVVLAEYDPIVWDQPKFATEQRKLTAGLMACARRNGLVTLDAFDALAARERPRALYNLWHMNAAGNRVIAELVAARLTGHDN